MPRPAVLVEGVDLQPAVVGGIARRPDNRGDPGLGKVQSEDRIGHAVGIRRDIACLGLIGQIEAIADGVGIRLVQHRKKVGVASREVVREVGREAHHALAKAARPAEERHPRRGEAPELDGPAALGTAHSDRDVLGARRGRRGVPLAEHAQPPAEIAAAIGARRAVVRPDREIDSSVRRATTPRRSAPPTSRLPPRALPRREAGRDCGRRWSESAVIPTPSGTRSGMTGRWNGPVAATTLSASIAPSRGLDPESGPADVPPRLNDLHAAADRCADLLGVGHKIVGDPLLRGESVGLHVGELHAREPVVPGGPLATRESHRPERQRSAMRCRSRTRWGMPHRAQVLAHRDPSLPGSDDERFNLLNRHGLSPFPADGMASADLQPRFQPVQQRRQHRVAFRDLLGGHELVGHVTLRHRPGPADHGRNSQRLAE